MKAAFLLAVLLLCSAAYARNVGMNFAYTIESKSGDTIRADGNTFPGTDVFVQQIKSSYVSSYAGGAVAGFLFAGFRLLSLTVNTTHSVDSYGFRMVQDAQDNRFVLAFARGSWQDVEEKALSGQPAPSSTFGTYRISVPADLAYALLVPYTSVDIADSLRIPVNAVLRVANEGFGGRGSPLVSIKLVS